MTRVLAVASAGGHWVQLFRMRQAWSGCEVDYVTTKADFEPHVMTDARERGEPTPGYHVVHEANRWQKVKLARLFVQITFLVISRRPDVVISTGAAPGYFALRVARLMGARTIWVDSIANSETMSLSGKKAGRHADVWLTQWEHLAGEPGPRFWGAVL